MKASIKKKLPVVIIISLLLIPIIIILVLTKKELQKYETSSSFTIQEKAFGAGYPVINGSIKESIKLEGKITSKSYKLYTAKNMDVLVKEKQEVFKGDVMLQGVAGNVKADVNGIVEVLEKDNDVVKIQLLNIDELVAEVTTSQMNGFKKGKIYKSDKGDVLLWNISNIEINGKRKLYFKMKHHDIYGATISFVLNTGKSNTNILMIENDAIYRNANGEKVVRIIDDNENVVKEAVVKTGISDGQYIVISGVNEGVLCDVEYAKYKNEKAYKEKVNENTN